MTVWWLAHGMRNYQGPVYSMEAAGKLAAVHEDSDVRVKVTAVEQLKS